MITIRKNLIYSAPGAQPQEAKYTWIDACDLNRDDISTLTDEYGIASDLLADIMDPDEQPRIEKDEGKVNIIVRIPTLSEDGSDEVSQNPVPLGVILFDDKVLTICQSESVVLSDLAKNRFRQYPLETREGFVLSILGRSTQVFLRLLKLVNRQKNQVESRLNGSSIKNFELIQLLNIQKNLVYYSTSLTMNQALMEKLLKTNLFIMNSQDERDFLDDVIIDNAQALSMAKIYSNILTVTTDSFASVISNNMNVIMKRLTLISLMLMFPTLITSFYGMNVKLPFAGNPFAWLYLLFACLLICVVSLWALSDKRSKLMIDKEYENRDKDDKKILAAQRKQRAREARKERRKEKSV
ncbi:MAG: magnesium transporter CorA family protein [Sphaerochaetaceae bacterium]|nr:magnesium transporter CorA family protein [Sphaerochaetaceae bacterium]MDD3163464.1 magnesium transporter CorA family protein [Sphaerochaetaceae bacterium]MDD4006542.1 magnesium transporter CorA family protein [Sphaerochaetaceae bacterium]MDD4397740.1 magnesium transporter CorA family protein [Sphaerochaetaceae bacterium]